MLKVKNAAATYYIKHKTTNIFQLKIRKRLIKFNLRLDFPGRRREMSDCLARWVQYLPGSRESSLF